MSTAMSWPQAVASLALCAAGVALYLFGNPDSHTAASALLGAAVASGAGAFRRNG